MLTQLLAPLTAGVATQMLVLLLVPCARGIGLMDLPGGRKDHAGAVPLAGGPALFGGFLVGLALLPSPLPGALPLAAAGALLLCVGMLDDLLDLGVGKRVLAQLAAAALLIWGSGTALHDLGNLAGGGRLALGALALPFTAFAIVGLVNAVNMLDGADGLAAGTTLAALAGLVATTGLTSAEGEVLLVLGACVLAFLANNLRPAGGKVFLGDSGSTLLGLLLAWSLITLSQAPHGALPPAAAPWFVAVPLLDAVSVMLRRAVAGHSPLRGDRAHLHHLLTRCGCGARTLFLLVAGASALGAGVGWAGATGAISEPALFAAFLLLFVVYFAATTAASNLARKPSLPPKEPAAP